MILIIEHLISENLTNAQAFGADLIVLDRTLRFYGPDAAHARDLLARYTERVLETTFPSCGQAPMVDDR